MWQHVTVAFVESFDRAAVYTARILPGLLAFVLIVTFALLLALVLRAAIARVLTQLRLDRRLRRWAIVGGDEWLADVSPTAFVARAGFWAVLLTGVFVALHAFEPTTALGARALEYVPQVLIAAILLAVGVALARHLQQAVLVGAVNLEIRAARLLSVTVRWLVLGVAGALALEHLGIGGRVLPLAFGALFGGVALAVALAVGLGSRDVVSRSWEKRGERKHANAGDEVHHL